MNDSPLHQKLMADNRFSAHEEYLQRSAAEVQVRGVRKVMRPLNYMIFAGRSFLKRIITYTRPVDVRLQKKRRI
jgi:hypothetical protein